MQGFRLLTALLACAALLPASAGASTCAGADTPVSAATLPAAQATVVCMVNAERTARGLPTLGADDRLALAAQRHSDDMVARDFFSHDAPAPAPHGADPGARITAAGYDWSFYGENIAVGFGTPRAVVTAWMASDGHCRNILAPDATQTGVGVAATPATLPGQPGATWTEDFARAGGARAPSTDSAPQSGCPYQSLLGPTAADASPAGRTAPVATAPGASARVPGEAPAAALHVLRAGHEVFLSGPVAAADGSRVLITLRHGNRRIRRIRLHVRHGHYHARIRLSHRHARYRIRLACGPLRITRSIS